MTVADSELTAREQAIAWILEQMEEFGIGLDDLPPPAQPVSEPPTPMYRSANGETWDGQGELPYWLQRAVNAGQTIDHFKIDQGSS